MKSISRGEFIKTGSLGFAATVFATYVWGTNSKFDTNNPLFLRLLKSNDHAVSALLKPSSDQTKSTYNRTRTSTYEFALLAAAYCTSGSQFFKSGEVLNRMDEIIVKLQELQYPNGTLDSGGNRQSPPDTAFLLEYLCPGVSLIFRNKSAETDDLAVRLKEFLLKAGEGLLTGGIHTPNHRWVISSALARLYSLFKDERYIHRIDQWLAEGVYLDSDGQFPERSRNYAAVEDRSLTTIGYLLNRPELFEIVEKNLITTYYFMEENGELITVDSRRQDQNFLLPATNYYLEYRFMAIQNENEMLAAVARKMEALDGFDENILGRSLVHFLERPILLENLPGKEVLPDSYTKYFQLAQVARIKRGKVTATIFGGNDRPIIIASGRSTNPTFFTFRKGDAILDYARLSTSFFNTGYFRSEGLKNEKDIFRLHEKKEAYYYQPMPVEKGDSQGDYKLSESLDGRFWSKMDFESRPVSNVQNLETVIAISESNGVFSMEIKVDGAAKVEVVLELCFRKGGIFSYVEAGKSEDDNFLPDGYATYQSGNDSIKVGPGKLEHHNIRGLDGELYSTHFGSLKGDGMHLYLTGYTPFNHTIKFQ